MILWSRPLGPVKEPFALVDREIVDAGVTLAHQAVFVELPVLVAIRPGPLAGIVVPFIGETNGNPVVAMGLLAITAVFQLFDTTQAVAAGILRGMKDTRVPMLYAMAGYWVVGIPTAVVLGLGTDFAGNGIWWGMTAGLAATTALMTGRVVRRLRRD